MFKTLKLPSITCNNEINLMEKKVNFQEIIRWCWSFFNLEHVRLEVSQRKELTLSGSLLRSSLHCTSELWPWPGNQEISKV